MLKQFHNDRIAVVWAIFVELAVHLLFSFQAFLLGGFLGEIALKSIFGSAGTTIGSFALGIFIFGAAFQAFVLGEYMREHVESFEDTAKGDGSYIKNWKRLRWLVGALEVSSLAFRCIVVIQQGDYLQAGIVALFGVVALWYAYAQAKVIHASVNRPVEYDIAQSQEYAGRRLNEKALQYVPRMTPEQLARYKSGDARPVGEVAESDFFAEEQKRQSKTRREEAERDKELDAARKKYEAQERFAKARETASNIFNPAMWGRPKDGPKPDQEYTPFMEAQASDIQQANRLGMKNGSH